MCTWIQAQVADLSHKIKRYGDLYHHAKLSRQQLVFEEARPKLVNPSEPQACLTDDIFAKSDTNTDDLQNNIFAKLQVHKNGLAKGLSSQQMTEIINERGSGARTIPVAKFPKHKYVKRNIRNEYKSSSLSYECSSLPAPFPCKQCQKACATGFGKTTGNLSAVFLDHSYHGQLSTKYGLFLISCFFICLKWPTMMWLSRLYSHFLFMKAILLSINNKRHTMVHYPRQFIILQFLQCSCVFNYCFLSII